MKKILVLTFALLLFSINYSPAKADTIEKETGFISVSESLTKEFAPNQAEVSVRIETSDKSMQKASADNKTIANDVYSSLKSMIGKDDYIKTSNYSARPQYITKDNKRILDKYIVTNSIIVRTKNVELISKLIDKATEKGATGIDNLQFNTTDYDTACNEALAELTKRAYTKANTIACSINSKITGVKSINANCNSEGNHRPYYAMMAKGGADNIGSTPIESGKIRVYVNVDASFYVK